MNLPTEQFKPGVRVRVTQQIPQRDGDCWTTPTEGVIVKFEQAKTGSWYAHAKDERLWLDRLTLRLDDGEVVVCNLDRYSHVDLLDRDGGAAPDAPEVANTEVEGGMEMEVTGHRPHGENAGEGVPDTPSGDLGQPTEKPQA